MKKNIYVINYHNINKNRMIGGVCSYKNKKKNKRNKRHSELIKYLNNKNYDEGLLYLEEQLKSKHEIDINPINRFLAQMIKDEDNKRSIKLYKLIEKYNVEFDITFNTLFIRLLCNMNKINEAIIILSKIPEDKMRRRVGLPILYKYCENNDVENAFLFLNEYFTNKFLIGNPEFEKIIKMCIRLKDISKKELILNLMKENLNLINENLQILVKEWIAESKITTIKNDGTCNICGNKLLSIDLNNNERSKLMANIKQEYVSTKKEEGFNDFVRFLKKFGNIDVLIDGCNVLFFKDRKITVNSFIRINTIIEKFLKLNKKVLLILHRRHEDYLDKSDLTKNEKQIAKNLLKKWKTSKIIYSTPYGMNDDWFFLYGSIFNKKAKVVSNDLFRDHIFKISEKTMLGNTLSKWIDRNVIRYDFYKRNYKKLNLKFPNKYSRNIQLINGKWHLPS